MKRPTVVGLAVLVVVTCQTVLADGPEAATRRLLLLQTDLPSTQAADHFAGALEDPDPLVARAAARRLGECGPDALPGLRKALTHPDELVRATAAAGLGDVGPAGVPALAHALHDPHVYVRQKAAYALAMMKPRSERTLKLLREALSDEAQIVREAAADAMRSLYEASARIPLPKDGWKFRLDPAGVGVGQAWYAADLDDTAWEDIQIERAWGECGHEGYVGNGWYRLGIALPARGLPEKAELAFGGVDENAWVWVNGEFAGEHAIGPMGWDKPFQIDVTRLLRWGAENQITVRAMNTAFAGGIWRPVTMVLYETAE